MSVAFHVKTTYNEKTHTWKIQTKLDVFMFVYVSFERFCKLWIFSTQQVCFCANHSLYYSSFPLISLYIYIYISYLQIISIQLAVPKEIALGFLYHISQQLPPTSDKCSGLHLCMSLLVPATICQLLHWVLSHIATVYIRLAVSIIWSLWLMYYVSHIIYTRL